MWNRITLKERGKLAFKANYWKCVLVAIISGLSTTNYTFTLANDNGDVQDIQYAVNDFMNNVSLETALAIIGVSSIMTLIGITTALLVFNPLVVGCDYYFIKNSAEQKAPLDYVGRAFNSNYWNVVLVMFMRNLFIFLWSLLFVIPGIIKLYSYRMVGYILAENPDMKYKEAITLSRKMMDGNKWRAFVLDLSFIGWILLGALTLGILFPFYVNPYMEATNAELYKALRDSCNQTGEPIEATPEVKTVTFETIE